MTTKPWFIVICVLEATIVLTGCGLTQKARGTEIAVAASATAAAPTTETPLPTSTPLPTDTPKPLPTVTPNIALTTTVEAASVLSELDVWVGSNSGIPYETGHLAWQQGEPVTIDMSGPQKDAGIFHAIDENINASNFIFKSDVTWSASGVLICGLAFRAEPNLDKGKQYQFYFYRLSGLPAYTINVYEFGRFKNTVSDIKFSDGVDADNGATNEFVLVAQDEQFTVYINGKRQGQFSDASKQPVEGLLAFLAWQESGKGSCTFENSWVWLFK